MFQDSSYLILCCELHFTNKLKLDFRKKSLMNDKFKKALFFTEQKQKQQKDNQAIDIQLPPSYTSSNPFFISTRLALELRIPEAQQTTIGFL